MTVEAQMRKHLEKWKESGLTKTAYATRMGLGVHKLGYWERKLKVSEQQGSFLPVGRAAGDDRIEIELPNKVTIKVPVQRLKELLPELLEVPGC